jgi:superfamily II helicase
VRKDFRPVQVKAITRYDILEGNSPLIFSPTSAKTFVGEVAAAKGVMEKWYI